MSKVDKLGSAGGHSPPGHTIARITVFGGYADTVGVPPSISQAHGGAGRAKSWQRRVESLVGRPQREVGLDCGGNERLWRRGSKRPRGA
jgi:hypothetical protein